MATRTKPAVTAWTPGPWTLAGPDGSVIWANQSGTYAHVATVGRRDNANLIAAAPELHAALDAIVRKFTGMGHDTFSLLTLSKFADELESARAVLAKARGET